MLTIPGLSYGPQMDSPATPAGTRVRHVGVDEARQCESQPCQRDAGRPANSLVAVPTLDPHSPDERPYRERFGTIASRLSSRLPGYTGSHPRDLRRTLADPKGNLRLYVSLDELDELTEYAIASYHGTPHGGLNNVTPLEAMEYFIRGRQQMLTWLPEHHRRTLCLGAVGQALPSARTSTRVSDLTSIYTVCAIRATYSHAALSSSVSRCWST